MTPERSQNRGVSRASGLDLREISPKLFAMLVIMAVVTTISTTPILELLHPGMNSPDGRI